MTIYAISTPTGRSAVAVLRVSGEKCPAILTELIGEIPTPRYAKLARIKNPATGETVDDALVLYFKAPHSFTGEDIIEFHLHGSKAVIKEMLEVLSGFDGVRPAEAGEFTKRAFYNNKFDLIEVEGIADLINAQTKHQKKQALRQLEGKTSLVYEKMREDMVRILAHLEAYIDFPEEDIPTDLLDDMQDNITALKTSIEATLKDNKGQVIREGIYVAIIGSPNVGKSSLLNYLSGSDVAIVSETAGTTRDVIEVNMDLDGCLVTIADTAGLRESTDAIESEGIKRARKKAQHADIKIAMFDISTQMDAHTMEMIDEDTIVVFNKADVLMNKGGTPSPFRGEGWGGGSSPSENSEENTGVNPSPLEASSAVNPSPFRGEENSAITPSPFRGEGWGGGLQNTSPPPFKHYSNELLLKARELRKNTTDVEKYLWHFLRRNQILDCKFRRQSPVGKYIVDFICFDKKLIIELDGGQHSEQKNYDEKRTAFLEKEGFKVLRFWNNEVFENTYGVLEVIYNYLASVTPTPALPPKGGGSYSRISSENCSGMTPTPTLPPKGGGSYGGETLKGGGSHGGDYLNNSISVSIKQNENVDKIIQAIKERISSYTESNHLITQERHRHHLNDCAKYLGEVDMSMPLELLCEELRLASRSMGKITGRIDVEELLDKIFSSFCIGK